MAQLLTGLHYATTEEDDVREDLSHAAVHSRDSIPCKRTLTDSSSRSTRYQQSTIDWEPISDEDGHDGHSMDDEEEVVERPEETLKNWAS